MSFRSLQLDVEVSAVGNAVADYLGESDVVDDIHHLITQSPSIGYIDPLTVDAVISAVRRHLIETQGDPS